MEDRGVTRSMLKRIKYTKLGKIFKPVIKTAGERSALDRIVTHGILERVGKGEYRRLAKRPEVDYYKSLRKRGPQQLASANLSKKGRGVFDTDRQRTKRRNPLHAIDSIVDAIVEDEGGIRIVPYKDGIDLLVHRGRVWIGNEVALTAIRRNDGTE